MKMETINKYTILQLIFINLKNQTDQNIDIKSIERKIQKGKESHKQQQLQIETTSMMTKYQLVFAKLEGLMLKSSHSILKREYRQKQHCFSRIKQFSQQKYEEKQFKALQFYNKFETKLKRLAKVSNNYQEQQIKRCFRRLKQYSFLKQAIVKAQGQSAKQLKTYMKTLQTKKQDIINLQKLQKDLQEKAQKELKQKYYLEQQLKVKDEEVTKLKRQSGRYQQPTDNNQINHMEEQVNPQYFLFPNPSQIRYLTKENEDLRDKLNNTEGNVGSFIKEMSDLLSIYEMSTGTSDGLAEDIYSQLEKGNRQKLN